MARILVLFAHPRSDRSDNNERLAQRAAQTEDVTLVDLYAEYPDFDIDIAAEQERLSQHDIIIFLHPVYWYSSPALLKEWQDRVLVHNFAYGAKGQALAGKVFLQAVTCGGPRSAYSLDGEAGMTLKDILSPFDRMARHCHMHPLPPFALFSAGHSIEENRRDLHVMAWEKLLLALRDERLDLAKAEDCEELCQYLDDLVQMQED